MIKLDEFLRRQTIILIVDDNNKNLQILGSILKESGYQVAAAKDGQSAIRLADKILPDLILLDVMMPGMSGFETCVKIKTMEKLRNIPIIYLSARNETEDIVKGFNTGAVDYVTKPFVKEELLARLRTHVMIRYTEKELKDLVAAKDKFFSIVAHDLRNPITSLVTLANLLSKNIDKYDKDKIKKMVFGIEEAAQIQYKLQENLLEWSRIQTDSLRVNLERFNLVDIINESIEMSKASLVTKEIELSFNCSDEVNVLADKNMVDTIMRNLLSNAIKFSYNKSKIEISCTHNSHNVSVSVSDHGMGMKSEYVSRLFDLNNKSTPGTLKEKGTGLGLVVCKEFVEKNDGELWAESKEGEGSVFTFTLLLDN